MKSCKVLSFTDWLLGALAEPSICRDISQNKAMFYCMQNVYHINSFCIHVCWIRLCHGNHSAEIMGQVAGCMWTPMSSDKALCPPFAKLFCINVLSFFSIFQCPYLSYDLLYPDGNRLFSLHRLHIIFLCKKKKRKIAFGSLYLLSHFFIIFNFLWCNLHHDRTVMSPRL